MPLVTNDIFRTTANLLWNNADDVKNVFHWIVDEMGTGDSLDLLDTVANALEFIYDAAVDVIPDNFSFRDISIFNLDENTPEPAQDFPSITAGESTGAAMPPADSVFCFARTGENRRIGKKWFPGFTEEQCVDGFWAGGAVSEITGFAGRYITPFVDVVTGAIISPGVVREVGSGNFVHVNFTSAVGVLQVYSRRTRRPGVGE